MFSFKGVEIAFYQVLLVLAIVVALIVGLVFLITLIQKRKGLSNEFTTKDLVYGAVCIAAAYALSFFGYPFPFGGTITAFSTVPIIIYCYYFGFKKSLIICTVYMILQLLQNPFINHPFSAVFDYILPYMFLSIVGIFMFSYRRFKSTNNPFKAHYPIFIGCFIYVLLRYASHVLSGILFWSEYAPENKSVLAYSLGYNSFVLVDFALSLVALCGLLASKSFNTFMASHRNTLQNSHSRTKDN